VRVEHTEDTAKVPPVGFEEHTRGSDRSWKFSNLFDFPAAYKTSVLSCFASNWPILSMDLSQFHHSPISLVLVFTVGSQGSKN